MVSQQYVCSFDLTTRAYNEEKKEVRGPETPSSSDLILASMTPITCRQTFSSRRWHTHAAEKLVLTKHGVNPSRQNRTICEALSPEWELLSQVTTRQDVTNLPVFVVFWSTICVMVAVLQIVCIKGFPSIQPQAVKTNWPRQMLEETESAFICTFHQEKW